MGGRDAADGTHPSLTVIVPAYNEAAALPATLAALTTHARARDWRVIVVDDCSTDGTSASLTDETHRGAVTVVRHKVRRGYGGAIKSGIAAAETDLVVTIDADGQHRLEDIEALYDRCLETGADMVVGDRGSRSSGLFREIGKRLIRFVTRLLVSLPIRDLNSGMKLYRTALARRYITICPDTMAYSDVIALAFVHARHLVVEHPIIVRPRQGGESTINTVTAFDTDPGDREHHHPVQPHADLSAARGAESERRRAVGRQPPPDSRRRSERRRDVGHHDRAPVVCARADRGATVGDPADPAG